MVGTTKASSLGLLLSGQLRFWAHRDSLGPSLSLPEEHYGQPGGWRKSGPWCLPFSRRIWAHQKVISPDPVSMTQSLDLFWFWFFRVGCLLLLPRVRSGSRLPAASVCLFILKADDESREHQLSLSSRLWSPRVPNPACSFQGRVSAP